MSDDRNNDFDDFQGFGGSNDFGDSNADGMHFSEEELEAFVRETLEKEKLPPKLPVTRNPPNPPKSTTCSTRLRIR